MINSIINYIYDFAIKSEAQYHVNPIVFCCLFFGSAVPLYYGYYRIGKSALKFEDRKLKRIKINGRELKTGVAISVAAWWLPYVSVIIFGRLPLDIWVLFILFVLVMGGFFIKALRSKIIKAKKGTEL